MKPKKIKVKAPRRVTLGFEKYSHLPPAIVDGKFVAPVESYVWAWRLRGGHKPSWYKCKVMKVTEAVDVDLWDEVAGQWFCFNTTATTLPDVRLSA